MDTGIGATLREARSRRKVDLVEVEAAIKIRVRYLQAIENEEWDALPGGAYTRGFIRTYGAYLGLDGDRLADDFRRASAPPGGVRAPKRVEPVPTGARRSGSRVSTRALLALVSAGLIAVLIGIALTGGEDNGNGDPSGSPAGQSGQSGQSEREQRAVAAPPRPGVALRLVATGEVWVCLLDAAGEPLVEGEILDEGAEAGPFRSRGFSLALGNGEVRAQIDGEPAELPQSSSPVGYEIDAEGELSPLEEGERPSCE